MTTCPKCGHVFDVNPPDSGKVFPETIIWEDTSEKGKGIYKGTAVILFPVGWVGKIKGVKVNGEQAAEGDLHNGKPVFRLTKTGDKYLRPLLFEIDTVLGVYTYQVDVTVPPPSTGYSNVAGHGILWKPVSEKGKLVVLINKSYGRPVVKVLTMQKQAIETGDYVYDSNPDRPTYRFVNAGSEFPRPCLLQVGDKFFTVPDGSKRYE